MDVKTISCNNTLIVHIRGGLTFMTAEDFRIYIETQIDKGENRFLIEMSALTYIDSEGIETLMRISKMMQKSGCDLVLTNLQPLLRSIFKLKKLDLLFAIYDTEEAGLKALS
jgi:anti-anti-sigma factor